MYKITQKEAEALRENKLERFVTVINKTHNSRAKTYYVVEDQKVQKFLKQYWEAHVTGVSACAKA